MKIEVTSEDILEGTVGDMSNPVARAIARAFGITCRADGDGYVTDSKMRLWRVGAPMMASPPPGAAETIDLHWPTPPDVAAWLQQWRDREPVEPFSFDVEYRGRG